MFEFPRIYLNRSKENIEFSFSTDIVERVVTLGITTSAPCLGITISCPPALLLPVAYTKISKKTMRQSCKEAKIRYGDLTPAQQYHFMCTYYIPLVFTPLIDKGIGIPELHKSGNVHIHMLCQDNSITNDVDLWTLRKSIDQTAIVRKITKGRNTMRLNYVHYLEDVQDWIKYMGKTIEDMKDRLPIVHFTN